MGFQAISKGILAVTRMTTPLHTEADVDALPLGAKTQEKARVQRLAECISHDPPSMSAWNTAQRMRDGHLSWCEVWCELQVNTVLTVLVLASAPDKTATHGSHAS